MLTVSNYHYIRQNFEAKYPSIFGVTPDAFEKQIKLLKNVGDIIEPNTLLNNHKDIIDSNDNYVLITFDDGLNEQYNYALPILDELNASAIFFVNSNNTKDNKISTVHKIHLLRSQVDSQTIYNRINEKSESKLSSKEKQIAYKMYIYDVPLSAELKYILNFKMNYKLQEVIINELFDNYFCEDELLSSFYMNKEQIKTLGDLNCLGSHTHNHYPLGLLNDNEIKFELEESKKHLESIVNSKVEMVAYPYGTIETTNINVAKIAEEVGYKLGFTTKRGSNTINDNYLLLNRYDCNDLIGGKKFKNDY